MKRFLPVLLAVMLLLVMMTGTALAENKFYFDKNYSTVFEDETLQLELIREGDCADEGQLSFQSSNQKVLKVDQDGVVFGAQKGTATVTATLKAPVEELSL